MDNKDEPPSFTRNTDPRARIYGDVTDLELSILPKDGDDYPLRIRLSTPKGETEIRSQARAPIDLDVLRRHLIGSEDYGRALTGAFFADSELRERFAEALALAREKSTGLRIRLFVDPQAIELHGIAWETLHNPEDNTPLSTNPNLIFSRYLSSQDRRPVSLRHQLRMNALALFANPSNLEEYQMAQIDVPAEAERLQKSMAGIPLTTLGREASGEAASLDNLFQHLNRLKSGGQSYFDILILVCHGSMNKGEPYLWLESEEHKAQIVPGRELELRIKELADMPMLVVLASCDSAKAEAGEALSALGPRLSQAGVPAVLAMQGKFSMRTNANFMPAFFEALQEVGVIDLAVSLARGKVRDEPDYWMPALFMRLRSGRIWYTPGLGTEGSDIDTWEGLKTHIQEEMCTMLLGPEIIHSIQGDEREIALQWAEKYGYPLNREDRDNLPRVAQFVSILQKESHVRIQYQKALHQALERRYPDAIPTDLVQLERWKPEHLLQALGAVEAAQWPSEDDDPYRLLARLGLPIYLTSEPCDLLQNALRKAGKEPQVRLCPWKDSLLNRRELWEYNDDPTPEKPLVYHLFGHLNEPDSLVYTEDDIFNYLIKLTEHRDLIPPHPVRAALADSSLLFVGFQFDDWQFRVITRLIMNQPGVEGLKEYPHVAAQIAPREGLIEDTERACKYIQRYLKEGEDAFIDLYWGTSQDFLKDLNQYMELR